jgi:hypothetical protein
MADSKQHGESFFRKVVRFVANPATDWNEIATRAPEDNRELELEKSELKAMIERKRRNDFVRKREFDMLRRLRREGLSPEQLAALAGSSRLDDGESRPGGGDSRVARADLDVKGKIDEIEQQMVGDPDFAAAARHRENRSRALPSTPPATTLPALLDDAHDTGGRVVDDPVSLPAVAGLPDVDLSLPMTAPAALAPAGAAPRGPSATPGSAVSAIPGASAASAAGAAGRSVMARSLAAEDGPGAEVNARDRLCQRRLRRRRSGFANPHRLGRRPCPARRNLARAF